MKELDVVIEAAFGRRQYVRPAWLEQHPGWETVREALPEDMAGPDVSLLEGFHRLRDDLVGREPSKANGKNGLISGLLGTWYEQDPDGKPVVVDGHTVTYKSMETNEFSREIPWRCFHDDPNWPCPECGHPPDDHYEFECSRCNCGNNSR